MKVNHLDVQVCIGSRAQHEVHHSHTYLIPRYHREENRPGVSDTAAGRNDDEDDSKMRGWGRGRGAFHDAPFSR